MESIRQRLERRRAGLKQERNSWVPSWMEVGEYIDPRGARFIVSDRNNGRKVTSKILDPAATRASRILGAGMKGGLTSEHSPWFQLAVEDPELNKWRACRAWLEDCQQIVAKVLIGSNIYSVLPWAYRGNSNFGTNAWFMDEDAGSIIRGTQMPIGSYCLATNAAGRVDACYRDLSMTARQLVERFGKDRVSATVLNMADRNQDAWVPVVHVVEPNPDFDPRRLDSKFKPFLSIYYEDGASDDQLLGQSGYNEFPVMASRWEVNGEDIYGGSIGFDCIGDVKQLQVESKRKSQLIDKLTNPPMNAPSTLKNRDLSILPGAINFHDSIQGQQGFTPTFQVDPHLNDLRLDIQDLRDRVRQHYHEDLFLMMAGDERSGITATEILAKKEEKIQVLGPNLTRLSDELLDPMIHRAWSICERRGLLPPPPPEVARSGSSLSIEYVSTLVQALKMSGFNGLQAGLQMVGNIGGNFPEAFDNIDPDAAVAETWDMLGVPARTLRDPKVRDQIRQGRAQQAQNTQALQAAQASAATAKTLADTQLTDPSALTALQTAMRGA